MSLKYEPASEPLHVLLICRAGIGSLSSSCRKLVRLPRISRADVPCSLLSSCMVFQPNSPTPETILQIFQKVKEHLGVSIGEAIALQSPTRKLQTPSSKPQIADQNPRIPSSEVQTPHPKPQAPSPQNPPSYSASERDGNHSKRFKEFHAMVRTRIWS